jgi:hypothetical protein
MTARERKKLRAANPGMSDKQLRAQHGGEQRSTAPPPDGRERVDKWVPDSSLGDDAFYEKAQFFLDDARLDPASDPTIAPLVDAIQREALEDYQRSTADLQLQAEGGSRYGRDYYMAALGRANEEFNEGLQGTLANLYNASRTRAEEGRLKMLGLGNERDIAAGGIRVQMAGVEAQRQGNRLQYQASMAATKASRDAQRAALSFERMKWNEEAPIRYLGAMTGLMGELNNMGGYNLSPGYVPTPGPPNTTSSGAIAASSLATGLNTYQAMGGFGNVNAARGVQ